MDALDLTLTVGKKLQDAGYKIYYTRTTDVYDSPYEKANATNAEYFISFYRNSSPTNNTYHGIQSLIYPGSVKAEIIGESINGQLENIGFKNWGIEERPNLVVLRKPKMPAVLVECGFLSNAKEEALLVTDEYQDKVAKAIHKGVMEY